MTDHTFAAFETILKTMSDVEVRDAYNMAETGSADADLLAGEMNAGTWTSSGG